MARTPADPNKAQVWVDQTGTKLDFEFYIPRGPKGDPGGFTTATELSTTDLNTVVAPGVYKQGQSNGLNSPLSSNYPYQGGYGILMVTVNGSDIVQRFYPQSYATGRDAQQFYVRNRSNNTWSAWRVFAAQRVDQTAGRAIYTWDDLNQREQLTWGDTGFRDIKADFINGWTASIARLARRGAQVTLATYILDPTARTDPKAYIFPAGFRPASVGGNITWPIFAGGIYTPMTFDAATNSLMPPTAAATSNGAIQLTTWTTSDPWPTTLPGVASGSIPNT